MNFKEVKELIELINSSQLAYFEIETADGHIKMDKSLSRNILSEEKDNEVVKKELPSKRDLSKRWRNGGIWATII